MSFHVVIPARYQARRLPGKALLEISGKPIIAHVYARACDSGAESVSIATDDDRIAGVCQQFGAKVLMTDPAHPCGTDRIAEAASMLNLPPEALIVNVQGDEPFIPPENIAQVADNLQEREQASVATLCEPLQSMADKTASSVVKVVFDAQGYAMYFSRASIPYAQQQEQAPSGFRHVGLYAYRHSFLQKVAGQSPCELETIESLEQLRWMWQGARIHVEVAKTHSPIGVDTLEDFEHLQKMVLRTL